MKKKALILLNDRVLIAVLRVILEEFEFENVVVGTPKDAVGMVSKEPFSVVFIGRHEGTVVKSKLADIIYEKSVTPKPHIVIMKEPGDLVHNPENVSVLRYPTFHIEVLDIISELGQEKSKGRSYVSDEMINSFLKFKYYEKRKVDDLLKALKGNKKFEVKVEDKKIVGFLMNGEIYVLYSDLDPYNIFSYREVDVAYDDMQISEFLSLQLGPDVFRIGLREFVFKALEKVTDSDYLLSFLPSLGNTIEVKAPKYVLNQCHFIRAHFDVDWLEQQSGNLTLEELIKNRQDLGRLRSVVAMYLLGMIDLVKNDQIVSSKYDVKIKKSFLRKIIDKIRGL